jgi:hypothetical protein
MHCSNVKKISRNGGATEHKHAHQRACGSMLNCMLVRESVMGPAQHGTEPQDNEPTVQPRQSDAVKQPHHQLHD